MYIPHVWSEKMPHGQYVFLILEFTMRFRFVESHMLDPPPPPDAIVVAFMKGLGRDPTWKPLPPGFPPAIFGSLLLGTGL